MTVVQKTGSVGASWPPHYDERNRRVKGFCTRLIDDASGLKRMFKEIRTAEEMGAGATRTTVRAFVREGLSEGLMGHHIEARFSVSNALPGYELLYFGRNSEDRTSDDSVLRKEMDCVRRMLALERAEPGSARGRVASAGYTTSRLNGDGQAEVGRLVELYREAYQEYTFELTPQTVSEMLSNGNVFIVGRDRNGRVVSSLAAEHVELALEDGRSVHLYELSDYATFREHRGNGLMTLMQMEVVETIRRLSHGPASVI
ncbi:MAG: GNAT family N-acetyltransferase, partial [Candidatus Micrarchaeota archaeon]